MLLALRQNDPLVVSKPYDDTKASISHSLINSEVLLAKLILFIKADKAKEVANWMAKIKEIKAEIKAIGQGDGVAQLKETITHYTSLVATQDSLVSGMAHMIFQNNGYSDSLIAIVVLILLLFSSFVVIFFLVDCVLQSEACSLSSDFKTLNPTQSGGDAMSLRISRALFAQLATRTPDATLGIRSELRKLADSGALEGNPIFSTCLLDVISRYMEPKLTKRSARRVKMLRKKMQEVVAQISNAGVR